MSHQFSADISNLKIALVYDWATTRYGGAELVLKTLLDAFPTAPLYTTMVSDHLPWVDAGRVRTTYLQKLPTRNHRLLVPLMPLAIESLDLSEFDIIISVSTGIALGVLSKPNQLHLCYLLAPPRYIYNFEATYHQDRSILNRWPLKYGTDLTRRYLRWWQNQACLRPDIIIPLSNRVRLQATKWYSRPIAAPIYPPINSSNLNSSQTVTNHSPTQPFWMVVNRLVTYKRTDLVIKSSLATQHRLLVLGDGPDYKKLVKLTGCQSVEINSDQQLNSWLESTKESAQPIIAFLKSTQANRLDQLYRQAQVVISPGIDDFGLVPAESVIRGTPAIWHAQSGVGEVLRDQHDGRSITEHSISGLLSAIEPASKLSISNFRTKQLQQQLSTSPFVTSLSSQLRKSWYTLNS